MSNRFRTIPGLSDVIPWRERAMTDPTAQALLAHDATDAEAADFFAMECARLRSDLRRALEVSAQPIRFVMPLHPRAGSRATVGGR